MADSFLSFNESKKLDFIGDIHGCHTQLLELLGLLGYAVNPISNEIANAPDDRILVFLGDLTDRGAEPVSVLRLVIRAVEEKRAICLRGNHDDKLFKALMGRNVTISADLQKSIQAIQEEGNDFKEQVIRFLEGLPYQVVIHEGQVIAAHSGMKEKYQGIDSNGMRAFALYGGPTGQIDEEGHPIRENWTTEYQGKAVVVYGHTPVSEIRWVNQTINLDTGCYKTGILTALKWPEKEIRQTNTLTQEE